MNKKNQYNIKDYINSFNTQKKIAMYLSVVLLFFYLLCNFISNIISLYSIIQKIARELNIH